MCHFPTFFEEVIRRASVEGYPPSGPNHEITTLPNLSDPTQPSAPRCSTIPTATGCSATPANAYSPVRHPSEQTILPGFHVPPPPSPLFPSSPPFQTHPPQLEETAEHALEQLEVAQSAATADAGWLAPKPPSDAYVADREENEEDDLGEDEAEQSTDEDDDVVEVVAISDDISLVELSEDTIVERGQEEDGPEETTSAARD